MICRVFNCNCLSVPSSGCAGRQQTYHFLHLTSTPSSHSRICTRQKQGHVSGSWTIAIANLYPLSLSFQWLVDLFGWYLAGRSIIWRSNRFCRCRYSARCQISSSAQNIVFQWWWWWQLGWQQFSADETGPEHHQSICLQVSDRSQQHADQVVRLRCRFRLIQEHFSRGKHLSWLICCNSWNHWLLISRWFVVD